MKVFRFAVAFLITANSCFAVVDGAAPVAPTPLAPGMTAPPALNQTTVVGALPYSNQWVYDKRQSILYLSYNRGEMAASTRQVGDYVADYGSANLNFPSIDYFVSVLDFFSPEGKSPLRGFSLWSRYGLGGGLEHGVLANNNFALSAASEDVYFATVRLRAGLNVAYDRLSWIQPYIGFEVSPFLFRQSSSMSGAEAQGAGALYGPVAGLHLPVLFGHRVSFYGEVRRDSALSDEKNVFGSNTNLAAGMGLVF